jgi:hypothetical protein
MLPSAFVYNMTTNNYREKQTLQALQDSSFFVQSKNINTGIDFNLELVLNIFTYQI